MLAYPLPEGRSVKNRNQLLTIVAVLEHAQKCTLNKINLVHF